MALSVCDFSCDFVILYVIFCHFKVGVRKNISEMPLGSDRSQTIRVRVAVRRSQTIGEKLPIRQCLHKVIDEMIMKILRSLCYIY